MPQQQRRAADEVHSPSSPAPLCGCGGPSPRPPPVVSLERWCGCGPSPRSVSVVPPAVAVRQRVLSYSAMHCSSSAGATAAPLLFHRLSTFTVIESSYSSATFRSPIILLVLQCHNPPTSKYSCLCLSGAYPNPNPRPIGESDGPKAAERRRTSMLLFHRSDIFKMWTLNLNIWTQSHFW